MTIGENWIVVDEVGSTQDELLALVGAGESIDVYFAQQQHSGRGRFRRPWHSRREASLTMSVALYSEADHDEPWIVGMGVAVAVARALDLELRWPNDGYRDGRKVAGVLTEICATPSHHRVPVVGIGVNIMDWDWPEEISSRATGARLDSVAAVDVARLIIHELTLLPALRGWDDIRPLWEPRDCTPGNRYMTSQGEVVNAEGIGPGGELIALGNQGLVSVLAADALFSS